MPVVRLKGFRGAMPALNAAYLPDVNGQTAINVDLRSPSLKPAKGPLVLLNTSISLPQAIYKYNSVWFEFTEDTNVVDSPVSNEAYDRRYYSGSTGPWVTSAALATSAPAPYPAASYRPGVPTPTIKPTVGASAGVGDIDGTLFYVYCCVNMYGEIGPPSPVSAKVTATADATVPVTLTAVAAGVYAPISSYNVYRTNALGTAFQFAFNTATTGAPVNDTTVALSNELPSTEWEPPPTDLKNLVSLPNAIQAGHRKNEILLAEPGLPHAWPVAYRKSVDYTIVAISALGDGAVVTTTGQPYLLVGTHPASMAPIRLEVPYANRAKRGTVEFGMQVMYPSTHGLVLVDSSGARLVSEQIWNKEQWEALNPSTFRAFAYRGLYIAFYTDVSGEQRGFMLDPSDPEAGIAEFSGLNITASYSDLGSGEMYVSASSQIARWDRGSDQAMQWRSKTYELPAPIRMPVIQVIAEAYPILVTVYRDGVRQARVEVGNAEPRKIPGARLGRTYSVEFTGQGEIREAALASSIQSIRQV